MTDGKIFQVENRTSVVPCLPQIPVRLFPQRGLVGGQVELLDDELFGLGVLIYPLADADIEVVFGGIVEHAHGASIGIRP